MAGVRLEAKVHIVTGAVSAAQNITKCIKHCHLRVDDIVLEQLASSYAVLAEDEKELGVCMVDMGGGTTDIAIFTEGSIRHTAVIPIAGDHVTNDVAVALRTPAKHAEQIKIKHGSVLVDSIPPDETIQVPSVAKRPPKQVQKQALARVINARYEELFALVLAELRRSGFEDLVAAGIVLTGGASNVAGAVDLAESIFQMPVRLGLPQHVEGLVDVRENPGFSTGVGLLLYGKRQREGSHSGLHLDQGVKGLWARMKSWFSGNF